MLRLAAVLFVLISATLMGIAIVVVLVAGYGTTVPIVTAAAIGFVLAMPVSWQVARAIY
ncbi:hypothetical protein SAMN05444722_2216 [Rhodovulum sp. ES.010]|uniref:CTP synthetase n=1 Tax=Rhodovulum sp. ES.010 TaxID=1882821 RepID=UPI0009296F03|nr:CTP synthetase [Rhodovulum sp. ES.010]SIO44797.1 hypothetical protein SAMN05444722_2216 [Rhodovulum sp. ES.010]